MMTQMYVKKFSRNDLDHIAEYGLIADLLYGQDYDVHPGAGSSFFEYFAGREDNIYTRYVAHKNVADYQKQLTDMGIKSEQVYDEEQRSYRLRVNPADLKVYFDRLHEVTCDHEIPAKTARAKPKIVKGLLTKCNDLKLKITLFESKSMAAMPIRTFEGLRIASRSASVLSARIADRMRALEPSPEEVVSPGEGKWVKEVTAKDPKQEGKGRTS